VAKERFNGVLAPVITPFKEGLRPDTDRFTRHCHWVMSKGVNLALFGTNSEANSLSVSEKIELLEHLISSGISGASLMPGTGCCALSDTVELTKVAIKLECRGVLMLPPFFYKGISDDGIFAFYAEVIEQVASENLAIYLYHIPPISQIPLSTTLIERLAHRYPKNIAGIKDSSGSWEQTAEFNNLGIPDFRVFCGSESFLLRNMRAGGAGCISATANVNPAAINDLYANWESIHGDQKQEKLNQIRLIFQSYPMIPALKAATGIYSNDKGWNAVRPPLTPLTSELISRLKADLKSANFEMSGLNSSQ
jgi:4-hydroxy-tetrahydrodipicolinate synthase